MAEHEYTGCRNCGGATKLFASSGKPARYCCARCAKAYVQRLRRAQTKHVHKCLSCASTWISGAAPDEARPKLCRKCQISEATSAASVARRMRAAMSRSPPVTAVDLRTCSHCGRAFYSGRSRSWCTPTCRSAIARAQSQRSYRARQLTQRRPKDARTCIECGNKYQSARSRQVYCGTRCSEKALRRNRRRRIRVAMVSTQRFTARQVFERDNWRCYLCGVDTPEFLQGSADAQAPSIDHVFPLSRGGTHSLDNVRCACRRCNSRKGASVPDMVERVGMGHQIPMAL